MHPVRVSYWPFLGLPQPSRNRSRPTRSLSLPMLLAPLNNPLAKILAPIHHTSRRLVFGVAAAAAIILRKLSRHCRANRLRDLLGQPIRRRIDIGTIHTCTYLLMPCLCSWQRAQGGGGPPVTILERAKKSSAR